MQQQQQQRRPTKCPGRIACRAGSNQVRKYATAAATAATMEEVGRVNCSCDQSVGKTRGKKKKKRREERCSAAQSKARKAEEEEGRNGQMEEMKGPPVMMRIDWGCRFRGWKITKSVTQPAIVG